MDKPERIHEPRRRPDRAGHRKKGTQTTRREDALLDHTTGRTLWAPIHCQLNRQGRAWRVEAVGAQTQPERDSPANSPGTPR